jgi:6-hydroxymethylpterin diphosphokinase MptE-like
MGGTARAGFVGGQAIVRVDAPNPEVHKYQKMWEREEYRKESPGEVLVPLFLQNVRPKPGSEVIAFGCGTGRSAFAMAFFGGLKVTMLDFAGNCLDEDIRDMLVTQAHMLKFIKHDLVNPVPVNAEYGYCTDVMEHIPEHQVDAVLRNVLMAAQHVFFSICTVPDKLGELIGETLHVTVRPYAWWLDKFTALGCQVHWSQQEENGGIFYVSAWSRGEDVVAIGTLNTTDQQVRANVRANIAEEAGWRQVHPHLTSDAEVMIVGGGPSALQYLDQIREMRVDYGVKLVTLNGAYNWAIERGLTPSAQIIVDAREFNARFTKPVVDGCKYLIASQCHPSVLEGLPKDRTYLWHTSAEMIDDLLKARYDDANPAFPVPGGSTVLLRAIPLLRMLGFAKFHLFGCDSCLANVGGTLMHHGYKQPENDGVAVIPTMVAGRVFYCHPWMISQGKEIQDLVKVLGDEIELEIYGDGMLAHMLRAAAEVDAPAEANN